MYETGEFVIFPHHVVHADAGILGRIPVSAGFIIGLPGEGLRCTGDSETLELKCRDEDTDIINKAFEGATFPDW